MRIAAAARPSTSSRTSARSTTRHGRPTAAASRSRRLKGGLLDLVSVRSREQAAAAAHQRCVRRSRSRVDAGRPRAGVGDGPVLVQSGIAVVRQLPHRRDVHRLACPRARAAARVAGPRAFAGFETGRSTNPEFCAGRHALFRGHAGRHSQRLSRRAATGIGDARHQHRVGRERHHAADAGDVGRVGGAGDRLHGVRKRSLQHLCDRHDAAAPRSAPWRRR